MGQKIFYNFYHTTETVNVPPLDNAKTFLEE
jgi:hypothetical protein